MGKFKLKSLKKKERELEKQERKKLRKILKGKDLIEIIGDEDNPEDGILLFGSHKNRKISELTSQYETSTYVYNYLISNKDLPKEFKRTVRKIIANLDPFDQSGEIPLSQRPLSIKQIDWEDDDIPF